MTRQITRVRERTFGMRRVEHGETRRWQRTDTRSRIEMVVEGVVVLVLMIYKGISSSGIGVGKIGIGFMYIDGRVTTGSRSSS